MGLFWPTPNRSVKPGVHPVPQFPEADLWKPRRHVGHELSEASVRLMPVIKTHSGRVDVHHHQHLQPFLFGQRHDVIPLVVVPDRTGCRRLPIDSSRLEL